jgi:uncharacterized protein DUF2863
MKRSRFGSRGRLNREAEQLTLLATGLSHSGSRVEDRYWDERLAAQIDRLLAAGNEDGLNTALEHLYRANVRAYDELADTIESRVEGGALTAAGAAQDALLIAAPLLAWSRYSIPTGAIPPEMLDSLRVQLQAHVLAGQAKLALADFLFSPDQLPRSYADTYRLAGQLTEAALKQRNVHLAPHELPETAQFLSDMRYVLGVVVASRGEALFRWQEADGSRENAAAQWHTQGGACLQPLLPACAFELLLPDAYHAACREADRQARPYSLRASVLFLKTTLSVQPAGLRAVAAPFYDNRLEEYRIGFTLRDQPDVIHGLVWPLLDAEDEGSDIAGQIEAALREAGVTNFVALDHRFPLEYCEDCGAPLYPSPDGEPQHAELPEEDEAAPAHLH